MYRICNLKLIKNNNKLSIKKSKSAEELLIMFEKCSKKVKERFNSFFVSSNLNISYDQWLILNEISNNRGIIQRRVAKNIAKETASVSRICKKLYANDLISSKSSKENKKASELYLTPKGQTIRKIISKKSNQILADIFNEVSEEEIRTIQNMLICIEKKF